MFPRDVSLLEVLRNCRLVFQACSNVTLEDVAVLDICCPHGRDSSLNLLVLVSVCVAVSLSQVDVPFNVLDLGVIDIYWCVVFHHHLCLRHVHLENCMMNFVS